MACGAGRQGFPAGGSHGPFRIERAGDYERRAGRAHRHGDVRYPRSYFKRSRKSMKIRIHPSRKYQRGILEVDLAMAMLILTVAIMPLAFSFAREREVLHADYWRAVADEVVDGEMEILAAGDWKKFPDGANVYTVHSNAATNLP